MSLISKQIDELRTYAKDRKGELAKLITDAADTIEMLSAKLHASQMERSSQYYHGGWIPCSERLPEPRMAVLGYAPRYQNIYALYYDTVLGWMVWSPIRDDCFPNSQGEIVAWMPLPEPYREEGD